MEEGLYLELAIEASDPDSSAMFGLQCICPLSLVQRRLSLLFLSWLLKFGLYTDSENISESRVCEAAAARRPSRPRAGPRSRRSPSRLLVAGGIRIHPPPPLPYSYSRFESFCPHCSCCRVSENQASALFVFCFVLAVSA